MYFWRDIFFPILILLVAVLIITVLINVLFRIIHFDNTILKIIVFFAIWYYVGPIIYQWMIEHFIEIEHEPIKILFTLFDYIMKSLRKLV